MRSKQNYNTNSAGKASKKRIDDKGLVLFKKKIEKYFFGEATIKLDTTKQDSNYHIIIGLNCNFDLSESLFYLNEGNWGGLYESNPKLGYSSFELAVMNLEDEFKAKVIIEEIAIHFKDTSLFITKIPNQDITNQLYTILTRLSENFVHFTRGFTEMPYEIFIPVFEEEIEEDTNVGWASKVNVRTSYFTYWGMYFYSKINQDSFVYDLGRKTIIDSDFFLLNNE